MRSVLYLHNTRMFQYGEHIEDMEKQMKRGIPNHYISSTQQKDETIVSVIKRLFLRTYQFKACKNTKQGIIL
jgi:hypothetical protein